jgi:hypothetical protein
LNQKSAGFILPKRSHSQNALNFAYIRIERKADILDDIICFTEEGLRIGKSPILLSKRRYMAG